MEVRVYSESQEQSIPLSSQPEYKSQQTQGTSKSHYRRTTEVLEPMEITRLRQELLKTAIQNHPDQVNFLDSLESRLLDLYEQARAAEEFNKAIEVAKTAEVAFNGYHSRRCPWLSRLGDELGNRYQRSGSVDDLDRAVESAEEAIKFTIDFSPEYPGLLNTLVSRLRNRYNYTHSIADLHRAIDKMIATVQRTSRKNPDRDFYLISLADLLGTRFDRTRSKIDIVTAIRHARKVMKNTLPDHNDRAKRLSILGTLLLSRYEFTGSKADLDCAIKHACSSAEIAISEQAEYPAILGNFAGCLFRRYLHKGSLEDLSQAIEVLKTAVVNISPSDPWYPMLLYNFGLYHVERFKNTNANQDLDDSIALYKQGLNCVDIPPSIRVRLAHEAAEAFAADKRWKEASNILDDAVALLPSISTRLLGDLDKQMALADATGLATFAAAAALNAEKCAGHALELLELGRGVIASDILDTRTSIMGLEQEYPELASELESLRDELDSPPPIRVLAVEWETKAKERRELHRQFRSTCDKIRTLPGFKTFLLPPNLSELKAAASSGPIVVINTNKYRCDAFLVREDGVQVLHLQNLRHTDFEELGLMRERGEGPVDKIPRLCWAS
ncbi:tpr-like protein [Fusarium flagelliforme]|uniref:Tpr-like protein n=1 Tax=Fusarium flagelliforme TaxID=2675880 RepID=A0A395MC12_9HYPO|nr:tpr-like protein [Fusarium flagelliforme]